MTRGAAREFVRSGRVRVILFSIAMLAVIAIGYGNDYQSCRRSEAIRSALRISFNAQANRAQQRASVEHGLARVLDLQAEMADRMAATRVAPLDCGSIPPPT
jgi:hypothetical protein